MKNLSVFFVSTIIFFYTSFLHSYSSDPKNFIEELVNEAINTLSNKDLNKDEKSKIIEKIALENVDIDALGLYTLGELRKSSNTQDLLKYKVAF